MFLKSSKKELCKLKETDPDLYKHCEKVWGVRKRRVVMELLSQYVFFLHCCYEAECCHPLCETFPHSLYHIRLNPGVAQTAQTVRLAVTATF